MFQYLLFFNFIFIPTSTIQSPFITYVSIFNFSNFTVLNKLLSLLVHNKIKTGTAPHYVKHVNNAKVVYTNKTKLANNNFSEKVTKKQFKSIQRIYLEVFLSGALYGYALDYGKSAYEDL